ncbi:MAG: DEAD/DEAH box helicase family protein [Patescibacteria group bacterium]
MITNDNWLTLEQASKYLSIGKTTLYGLAQNGKIPVNKVKNRWVFNRELLDEWVLRSKGIKDFFKSTHAYIEDNYSLREPQMEAYVAVRDYFDSGNEVTPAIVQLPVGCGKSGTAAIVPFGVSSGRVLVLSPNLTIRDELRDTLDLNHSKCFWKKTSVLREEDMLSGPYVTTLENSNLSICQESHFVVSNVQQLATNPNKWLDKFESDFFDMIIVDEAHHSPAKSWTMVFNKFTNAKKLFLTATPFRSDKQEIEGKLVYRYSFKSATTKGFIKRLASYYVAPDTIELKFTDEKSTKEYTLEEILKMKEEDWFSRGIATSEACNISIVDNSLGKLEELRLTGTQHQIIAVAMSISHAEKICSLYNERGYTTEVIHSKMDPGKQEEVKRKLKAGLLDCIVQVQMLGEGFDHPKLSVAAIFNPFRSLSPYIQFVGRILRVVVQNSPGHPDNYGYIVTHIGMNLDNRFEEFRAFDSDDEEFWASVLGGEPSPEPSIPREDIKEGRTIQRMEERVVVNKEIVDQLFTEDFLDDEELLKKEIRSFYANLGVDITEELIEKTLESRHKGMDTVRAMPKIVVQPQKEWQGLRARLDADVSRNVKAILNICKLEVTGIEIPFKYGYQLPNASNNLVALKILLNQKIKYSLGNKERNQWSITEFKEIIRSLPEISRKLRDEILAKQSKIIKKDVQNTTLFDQQ